MNPMMLMQLLAQMYGRGQGGGGFQQPGDFGGFRPPQQPQQPFQQPGNFGGFRPDLSQQQTPPNPQTNSPVPMSSIIQSLMSMQGGNSTSGITGGNGYSNQAAVSPNLDQGFGAYMGQRQGMQPQQSFQQPGNFGGFRPPQQYGGFGSQQSPLPQQTQPYRGYWGGGQQRPQGGGGYGQSLMMMQPQRRTPWMGQNQQQSAGY